MVGAIAREGYESFDLPVSLAAQGFALRPEVDADEPFLLRLYASTRAAELAPLPWPPEQMAAFVKMQFAAQRRHYRAHIPNGVWLILEHQGRPTGRLYLEHGLTRLHIVDIALAEVWRGRGVGTIMLRALKTFADRHGKVLGIFVEKPNPALRLYRRLGFMEVADTGVYLEMEWGELPAINAGVSQHDLTGEAVPR